MLMILFSSQGWQWPGLVLARTDTYWYPKPAEHRWHDGIELAVSRFRFSSALVDRQASASTEQQTALP